MIAMTIRAGALLVLAVTACRDSPPPQSTARSRAPDERIQVGCDCDPDHAPRPDRDAAVMCYAPPGEFQMAGPVDPAVSMVTLSDARSFSPSWKQLDNLDTFLARCCSEVIHVLPEVLPRRKTVLSALVR